MENKKILVVSQIIPFPPQDGGRVDIYYRLQALKELGYEITLVAYFPSASPPDKQPLEELCEDIYFIPYERKKLSKVFSFTPYFVGCREDKGELGRVVIDLKRKERSFLFILSESHHVYSACSYLKEQLRAQSIYLRSHNNEPKFIWSLGKTSPIFSLKRYFFFIESFKYYLYEQKLLKQFPKENAIFHISLEEYAKYSAKYPEVDHRFLPAAIDIKSKLAFRASDKKNVLFVGALFSPNNLHGLKWYLQKIHKKLCEKYPDYQLIVAGNTKGACKKSIKKMFEKYSQILFYDTPKDLSEIYGMSQVFINPMQFGAGVKLKTLNAILNGMPVVSTTVGNEGTGLLDKMHIHVHNDPIEFKNALENLLSNPGSRENMVEDSQGFIMQTYDQKNALLRLVASAL